MALRRRSILDQPPATKKKEKVDFAFLEKLRMEAESDHREHLSDRTKNFVYWFDILMRISNEVFIIEYYGRVQSA
jgi:hypothetical protein